MKLADGIHYLGQDMGGQVHAFLLDDGNGITLIDALYDDDGKLILDEINTMGRQPSDLKNIVAAHAHRSHIGGIAELTKQTNARVYAHEWEICVEIFLFLRVALLPCPVARGRRSRFPSCSIIFCLVAATSIKA